MKKIQLAFIMAVIISGLFISQASATTVPSEIAATKCGKTYTVVGGDTLTKIANKCGTSVSSILELNPSIADGNMIYSGQVIQMRGVATVTTTTTSSSSSTTYYGNALITLSDYRIYAGYSIVVKAYNFPANSAVKIFIYKKGSSTRKTYDATTNSSGSLSKTITVPSSALDGQTWEVKVMTSNQNYVTSAISSTITIISSSDDDDYIDVHFPDAEVTLSKSKASAGDSITAYVTGFPKGQYISYCVRPKSGSSCRQVYFGYTDGIGNAQMNITIPSTAKSGDNWVVFVATVSYTNKISDVSPKITIK